ncbi:MAG: alkaline phosphatase family protein [Vicinamibacteria bacterium]|nr:alkaline phosphatase family protein [Vicinamibacteria bacterium]
MKHRTGLVIGLLLTALGAASFGSRMWDWVLNFDPGFSFAQPSAATGAPLSAGVTVLLVDGLRLDASRRMETLNALRARGADIEGTVGTPSFSRPGRATIAVGAYPAIHGVTTNRQKRMIPLDNIIRRVGALGGRCRIAGSKIWPGLFGKDIEACGVYRAGEGKEGPGAFVRQVGEVRASQEAGIAFVMQEPAMLRIADIISTDFAAHEYGGASPEYLAEVQRTDPVLAALLGRLDLSRETLIVTADHGHRDAGGHGGEEAQVLAIPIVMAGAGIRPGAIVKASQADIAPTIAVLLGAPLPTASEGAPIESALALDESGRASIHAAAEAQHAAFERSVSERLGVTAAMSSGSDFASLAFAQRERRKAAIFPALILACAGIAAIALVVVRLARASRLGLWAGAIVGVLALFGPIGSRIPPQSFSAINYDEMLVPFFLRIMTLAAALTVVAAFTAALTGRIFVRRPKADWAVDSAGAMGLLLSAALAMVTVCWWWRFDLLAPLTLPGPDRLVESFSLTLATFSTSVTGLLLMAGFGIMEVRASRSRLAPGGSEASVRS